jgi:O-antigen/teichoic acid export membrane protein
MDNVTKVTFPAFSRMQDNKEELEKSLTRSIFFICALVFPSLIGLCVVFPNIIAVIPKYAKWSPAYIPLLLLSVNSLWAAASTQLTNFLNSVGKIKTTFKLMMMWTALTWALVPILSLKFSVIGAGWAYLLIGSSSAVVFYIVKRQLNWSIYRSVVVPLVCAGVMGVITMLLRNTLPLNAIKSLVIIVLVGGIAYSGSLYLFLGQSLFEDVKKISTNILKK